MLRYGYFDSEIIGYDEEDMPIFDRAESSDFLAMFISSLVSDGVLGAPSDCFQVVAYEGMTLKVRPGFGIVRGRFAMDDQEAEIEVEQAPPAYKRIDRVILRANYLERKCEIVIRSGIPAERPVAPKLQQPASGDYYELCLANVSVIAKQTVITQSSITDTRYDSRVCGVVTQLIDHLDTSVFFAQLNSFYQEFVEQSDSSYEQFVRNMEEYLSDLTSSGDEQLGDIVQTMTDFEADSEQQWVEWFEGIQQTLTSVENGEMLSQILNLIKDLYNMATDQDIDDIIDGSYADVDDEGSIFEPATDQDIDDIINGTYIDSETVEEEETV